MATYELWYTSDTGRRLALLSTIEQATFLRVTNGVGRFSMILPASFDTKLLKRDRMIQVWRSPKGGRLSLFRVYLVRWWNFRRIDADMICEVRGPCLNDLLRRRYVINYTRTANAHMTDQADDMCKAVVDDHLVSDTSAPVTAAGSRVVAGLSVQGDLAAGPSLTESLAWRNVLDTLTDIAQASRAAGTEIFWDIVASDVSGDSISVEFRTKTGQPGQDQTSRVVFDEARGNLERASYTYDAATEVNYVYGGGQGQGTGRNIEQQYDATRYNASRWNRCEGFAYAAYSQAANAARDAARQKLAEGEPKVLFTGKAIDTEGTRFGKHWNWGDKVTARFLGQDYESIIRKVQLTLDADRHETIDARLEYVG